MRSTGCKVRVQPLRNTTVFSRWKAVYSLKGKALYGFYADTRDLEVHAHFDRDRHLAEMGCLLKESSKPLYGLVLRENPRPDMFLSKQ